MAMIPDDIAIVGGMPVSSLLEDEDEDSGPGGAEGWYFYLEYEAAVVPFTP